LIQEETQKRRPEFEGSISRLLSYLSIGMTHPYRAQPVLYESLSSRSIHSSGTKRGSSVSRGPKVTSPLPKSGDPMARKHGAQTEGCTYVGPSTDKISVILTDDGTIKWVETTELTPKSK
jgi:hypothetical protein